MVYQVGWNWAAIGAGKYLKESHFWCLARQVGRFGLWDRLWNLMWGSIDIWKRFRLCWMVQIVLDKELLEATDKTARRTRRNRSALVRDALRGHLQRLEGTALEGRDGQGYSKQHQSSGDSGLWEMQAAWPASRSTTRS